MTHFELFDIGEVSYCINSSDLQIDVALPIDDDRYYGTGRISQAARMKEVHDRGRYTSLIATALANAKQQAWNAFDIERHATCLGGLLGPSE